MTTRMFHHHRFYLTQRATSEAGIVATLGNFDGVHSGHQELIKQCREQAGENRKVVLISFYPHPAQVLKKIAALPLLTSIRQKCAQAQRAGADELIVMHFSQDLAAVPAEQFINSILLQQLNIHILIIGADARVGQHGKGDAAMLQTLFRAVDREVIIIPFIQQQDQRISSRRIRELLVQGEVAQASKLLGRPYAIDGHVAAGDKRGRKLGFPTLNLSPRDRQLPQDGVYATHVIYQQQRYQAITNVGVRPTFGSSKRSIETHLLNCHLQEIYGKRIEVEFVDFIRQEIKFANAEALQAQIAIDIQKAQKILATVSI